MTITLKIQFDRDLTNKEREALMLALVGQVENIEGLRRGEWMITNSSGEKVDGGDNCWFIL